MGQASNIARVGILPKKGTDEADHIAAQIAPWLKQRGIEVFFVGADVIPAGYAAASPQELDQLDSLVVLGGDGTLLHGAALVAEHQVPILGVNLGRLGFLASCGTEEITNALESLLRGDLAIEQRMRLRCEIVRGSGRDSIVRFACNDAVVSQGALSRLIEFDVFLNDLPVTRYRADGLIVSTPTGSTAYTLAAGGPIVLPGVEALVVTPICPHMLAHRPLIAPATDKLRVELIDAAEHVQVTVDGQWGVQLEDGDRFFVSRAEQPLRLYRWKTSYFDVLRQKLGWGFH